MMCDIRATVDRIEGDKAVLLVRNGEEEEIILPVSLLPDEAGEGSILELRIELDQQETSRAEERVKSLIEKLRNKTADQKNDS